LPLGIFWQNFEHYLETGVSQSLSLSSYNWLMLISLHLKPICIQGGSSICIFTDFA